MNAEAQRRSRAKREASGYQQVAVMLKPEAAAKLAAWVAKGETKAGIINRLLERSKP